jgi:plasmid stabilization system protein ParE
MKLILSPESKVELSGAAAYYRLKSPSAAVNFRREVKSVMARIRATPQQFPFISTTVRRALTEGFPYNIFFEEYEDGIRVLGIIHSSRDPFLWQNR